MKFGIAMFMTDYSMQPAELAVAVEERGLESLWAPEHSHIPLPRVSPWGGGGELPKKYYDVMDPFVCLAAAAAVTKSIKLATGVALGGAARSLFSWPRKWRRWIRFPAAGFYVRRRRWLECGGDGGPWHRVQDTRLQADARAHRGDAARSGRRARRSITARWWISGR